VRIGESRVDEEDGVNVSIGLTARLLLRTTERGISSFSDSVDPTLECNRVDDEPFIN